MSELTLRVHGLRELQKALRETAEGTPKVIQQAHRQVVEEVLIPAAKRNLAGTSMVDRVKAFGTTREAGLRFLGHKPKRRKSIGPTMTEFATGRRATKTDAYLQEFGGRAPLFGNRNRWYTVKPKKRSGYFIYPAIRDTHGQFMDAYLKVLDEALRKYWAE